MTTLTANKIVLLRAVQKVIQQTYLLDIAVDVADYLIDDQTRDLLRRKGVLNDEELYLVQEQDELHLALYVSDGTVARMLAVRARDGVWPLREFCLLVEGVSHFIYVIWKAQNRQDVSGLELEVQAEIDKFVICLRMFPAWNGPQWTCRLRTQLFERIIFLQQNDPQIACRYRDANRLAGKYCQFLETKFVRYDRRRELMGEVRRFYRMGPRKVGQLSAL